MAETLDADIQQREGYASDKRTRPDGVKFGSESHEHAKLDQAEGTPCARMTALARIA